ncbi:protein-arginine deiminase family protein [Actinomadura sp. WMMA1423]|uniref:protein-arginine deiminase family protein n=1 Tax=Actinomadura sp. WMMA1423 TaxID=2591108 RepID=UPI001146F636|nr:protein-arginine deiminase family protein [Actinomadura sp. WMMA1423]
MTAYRLHADYDRDGRVSARPGEWARRLAPPGALVRANLDNDTRRLPAKVTPGDPVELDRELPVKTAGDDEPAGLLVEEVAAAPGPLFVVLEGADALRCAVIDATGRRLAGAGAGNRVRFRLPVGPFPRKLSLEAVDLPAVPAGNTVLSKPPPGLPGNRITVRLERDDPGGTVVEDEVLFTLSPFVLIGNAGALERLYMCQVTSDDLSRPLDDNQPAVAEVQAALQTIGVPLTLIPMEAHGGDSWIQDQYQLGFTETPDGPLRVLLHTPRTRSDAAQGVVAPNLSSVVTGHFPSRDLGLCQSFWDRELTITSPDGSTGRLGFVGSDRALVIMIRVKMLRRQLFESIARIGTEVELNTTVAVFGDATVEFFRARNELPALAGRLKQVAKAAADRPDSPWFKQHDKLARLVQNAEKQVEEVRREIPVPQGAPQLRLRLPAVGKLPQQEFLMAEAEVGRLEKRLQQWHSSHNFGGNIEVGPPHAKAPAGVVVVGNQTTRQPDGSTATDMDPELLAFLRGQTQSGQRVLEVDTSWLDVGHVDEVLAFVPDLRDPQSPSGAVLRSSPLVALRLIEAARQEFMAGLSPGELTRYKNWLPIRAARLTYEGANPVTHLLRGLQWLHQHERGQLLPIEPPEIYLSMATWYRDFSGPIPNSPLPLPDSPWRPTTPSLPAGISIFEFDYFRDGTNEDLEDPEPAGPRAGPGGAPIPAKGQLTETEEKLTTEYGAIEILKLPVLFDDRSALAEQTAAFTPNLANLQVAAPWLLVPRPHGPRMDVEAAVRVLRTVAQQFRDVKASRFTPQWLRARGLDRTVFWARAGSVAGDLAGDDAEKLTSAFLDGWPRGTDRREIRRQIIRANPGAFDSRGFLRGSAWRKLQIPERKVDLFEAWTEAVADRLGYRVSWVEAWYYHVRLGSIHCGTNTLRAAPAGLRWWR